MHKTLIPFLILFISYSSSAQNYFKGSVKEEDTSMSVTGAIVSIEGTELALKTDLNGSFNFTKNIPEGEHVVTIAKDGYVTKYALIEVISGKNIIMDNILIEVKKKEQKRREKALKAQQKQEKKEQKIREKLLAKAKKEKEKEEKRLAKQQRKNKGKQKGTNTVIIADNTQTILEDTPVTPEVTSLQIKYGTQINVTPETLTNFKLYEFIQEWEGTDYLMGGATKDGIDCSSFTQRLYTTVYNKYIERTAEKQFDAKDTEKFTGREFLKEGDLVFFKGSGEQRNVISHVGVYLHNGYFVNSTSYSRDNGEKGVKICNLNDNFWAKRFVAGGRRQ